MNLQKFTEEKIKGLRMRGVPSYEDIESYLNEVIQETAHFVKEAIVPEENKEDKSGGRGGGGGFTFDPTSVSTFNQARQQILDKFNELTKNE